MLEIIFTVQFYGKQAQIDVIPHIEMQIQFLTVDDVYLRTISQRSKKMLSVEDFYQLINFKKWQFVNWWKFPSDQKKKVSTVGSWSTHRQICISQGGRTSGLICMKLNRKIISTTFVYYGFPLETNIFVV